MTSCPETSSESGDPGTGAPALSIVVPANDEAGHIVPCLEAVLASAGVGPGALEVIVAANGCTDDTVALARALAPRFGARGWQLTVLDIPEGGKAGALNRAEDRAAAPARAFLDADIVVDSDLLAQVLAALDRTGPVYVTGRMRVARAKSWVSRRYGALWVRLPFMAPGTAPGAGFFAVNAPGRARWDAFPDIIADDSYVRWLFAPHERVEVRAGYSWPLVEGFAALVRVRRRQDAGGTELARLHPELAANEGKPPAGPATQLRLAASMPVSYAVYVAVKLAGRIRPAGKGWARGRR